MIEVSFPIHIKLTIDDEINIVEKICDVELDKLIMGEFYK
jgi:hypothetical protein